MSTTHYQLPLWNGRVATKCLASLLLLISILPPAVFSQQTQSPEAAALARMREAMKQLNQRVATADAATAEAQAKQVAAEAKVAELEAMVKKLTGELKDEATKREADKDASDKEIKGLKTAMEQRDQKIGEYEKVIATWQDFGKKAEAALAKGQSEVADAKSRIVVLQREVDSHVRKNREMYALALEVLERYKSFGLGTALAAREPFVGSMRVKFQNYVQDYGDKLATQRIDAGKPGSVKSSSTEPAKKP